MQNNVIAITNPIGQTEFVKILKYFKFNNSNSKYIIYTNNNNLSSNTIFAAEIIENDNEIILNNIEDQNIISKIQQLIDKEKNKWMN